jgi:hypothetical protein
MSSSSDMPAVEALVGAAGVAEPVRLGAATRGVVATADAGGALDAPSADAAGRTWTTGAAVRGGSFFGVAREASA